MKLRRPWRVYKFYADPPPWDFVELVSEHWMKGGAENKRQDCGPTGREFVLLKQKFPTAKSLGNVYFEVHHAPKKRRWWRRTI